MKSHFLEIKHIKEGWNERLERFFLKILPEKQHQRTEKGLKIVVLIDVTLIVQLDVSKHLQKTASFYFIGSTLFLYFVQGTLIKFQFQAECDVPEF